MKNALLKISRNSYFQKIIFSLILYTLCSINSFELYSQAKENTPRLFIGGGALPDHMYDEFFKLVGPEANLVVIPTATGREIDEAKIKESWYTTGFKNVTVLHTRDSSVAAKPAFSEVLIKADAVWFSGGSQQRIADAYLNTPVEEELYKLVQRGGVIGGSSAGAAIMTRTMISRGNPDPEITNGFDLLPGYILDQHFLKRNRLSRLSTAVRANPNLIGLGIDEATAVVLVDNELKVIGESYVIRIAVVEGRLQVDAFEAGEMIPLW